MKGEPKELKVKVNGKLYELKVKPKALLSDVLRKELKLTGTKRGVWRAPAGSVPLFWMGRR
jgi:aerobic-type carbon monoxide dehydrogenase small subunit (CoxS/CutS family)